MHKIERKQIGATASLNTIFVSTAQAWPMSQIPLMQARAHLVQVRITLQTFWSKKLTRVPENKPCFVFPDFLSLLPPELLVTIPIFPEAKRRGSSGLHQFSFTEHCPQQCSVETTSPAASSTLSRVAIPGRRTTTLPTKRH